MVEPRTGIKTLRRRRRRCVKMSKKKMCTFDNSDRVGLGDKLIKYMFKDESATENDRQRPASYFLKMVKSMCGLSNSV